MAKKKKEKVAEEAPKVNEPKGEVTKVKEKMKMKPIVEKETVTKVNLNESSETEENTEVIQEVVEEIPQKQDTVQNEDVPVIEEVTDEVEKTVEVIEEAITESTEKDIELPENIQKLMDFMVDTGGDLRDYVNLNQNYSELDNDSLLREYYKQTKPHLDQEEIEFLMEDNFSFDENDDNDKEIRRKKLALKEQVADAKDHLDGLKSKYYEDIKSGSKLTSEQQKAIDFFNRYNKESKEQEKALKRQHSTFTNKTDQVFNDKFKGFEYNVGDKRYRFNVNNADQVKETQSDINNFVKKFLNENNEISDVEGYHKSLFTAMNADSIANHFYEQGKVDALKTSIAESKNINMNPRQQHNEFEGGGIKVKALGESSNDFKFKIKQK